MKRLNSDKMKLMLVMTMATIVFGGGRVRADIVWTQKADMPTTRNQHSASVVGGKIYVIGGWNAIGEWNPQWEALTRVDVYDPATDTWTRKADMPTARGHTNACVVDGKIYVMDGGNPNEPISIVEVYDPATDTWTQQTELPTKRWQFTTSVVDGIIYVIGGWMSSISSGTGMVEAYDPMTDTWTRKTDMPTNKRYTSSCVVDGKIYVIGGAWARRVVEAYDPATDTWTTKSSMPTPRYCLDAVAVDGKIYAIGGWYNGEDGPIYSTVEVYDPMWNTWTKGVDIPVTTAEFSASVVDGKIYVIGGSVATHTDDNSVLTSAVYGNEPIIDFNGDGIVDSADICIMIDHWGENYSLFDIGPTPFGDGVVDVQDLIVLAEHLFEEVPPPKPIVVDDFESYTDTFGNIIWNTWMDFVKNNTGARLCYVEPPYAEVQIVHGGNQAMPFFYENDGTVLDGTVFEKKGTEFYAEAQRQWEIPQDWTIRGVEVLTLWFYGEPDNSADPFYVVLEDHAGNRKEVQHPNPAAVTLERWEQWSIPIADFTGVDPKTIKIMGIGVGDPASSQPGGSGLLRIDDIELHSSSGQ